MPRPDVARLGIGYRRIPLLAIGRDVYLDTRLQLQKLEALDIPAPRLGSSEADHRAIERLLSSFMTDAGVFGWAASLLPSDLPLLKDPAFQKDREEFSGVKRTPDTVARVRPVALRELASVFKLLETTLLADNREWILNTPSPSLADIEAIFPLHWMVGVPGALPKDKFSPEVYPKVYAWIGRFDNAVKAAGKKLGKQPKISGEEASKFIVGSQYHESEIGVDKTDHEVVSLGLAKGDPVVVGPTDSGRTGIDNGRLVGIGAEEVVYETGGADGAVRVHAPRHGFRIRKGKGDEGKL
ncbi:hypothetical protein QQS21_008753 [Conoideocrella luteorostrata]|uniref:DUF7962 domain-containing protein n=1 Tax=Conoideocrella luteorostrata TaxID=1105319 RepID=A0AAJ0CIH2_9HYPO|nr:hypothetical protein QQS21_008753 [Conoideocrella luteorostrata]